ncbi:hypothetical protein MKY84_09375 [Chryseomicrobium sp. FSL W7-1435]|uniref:hypothetical protein n=1 Tax=Chryseomicrobium sp. FSL W7-1435 TaxID=2921704 RepID=UPI00315A4801
MTNGNYSDKQLENLLSSMPKQQDNRSKEDVLQALSKAKVNKVKKSKPWLPAFITVAALFVLVLFVQSMMNTLQLPTSDSASEGSVEEMSMSTGTEDSGAEEQEAASMDSETADSGEESAEESAESSISMLPAEDATVVFAEDPLLIDYTIMPFSLNYQAVAFPITVLIPNERIATDFGEVVPSQLELIEKYSLEIQELTPGFDEYYPLVGNYQDVDGSLEITLPDDHPYDMASASMEVYFNSLKDLFGGSFSEAFLVNEAGELLDWDQVGPLEEPIDLSSSMLAYSPMQNATGDSYLVPYPREESSTFEEALERLRNPGNSLVEPILPSGINFSIEETEQQVTVIFTEWLTADSMPRRDLAIMVESLVVTAASFGKSLVIENWDESLYPLPEDTRSLVGINKIVLPVE